jgi:hypothetical protein
MLFRPISSTLFCFQSVSFVTLASPLQLLTSSVFPDVLNTNLAEYALGIGNILVDVTIDVFFRLSVHIRSSRSTFQQRSRDAPVRLKIFQRIAINLTCGECS